MAKEYKYNRKQLWMQAFENGVVQRAPHLAGKLEWDTATYFFNQGLVADEAAAKYASTRGGNDG